MSEKVSLRNPITTNVILSLVALATFVAGGVWFVTLMQWPNEIKIIFSLIVVLLSTLVIWMFYKRSREITGDISIDLESETFVLNKTAYSSFKDLNTLSSRIFTTSRIPQASGFSATYITLGVGKNTMTLNSMDAAKGLTMPQLEGLHKLVVKSSLNDEQKELFESFMETVRVIRNIQNKV